MNNIQLTVKDRAVTNGQTVNVAAGNVNMDTITASFDSEWASLSKTVVFSGGGKTVGPIAYSAGMAIPHEVCAEGCDVRVTFIGTDSTHELRTLEMDEPIAVGGVCPTDGDAPSMPTRSIIDECLAATDGAENVNATMSGTSLTVTDRTGASVTVDCKGADGAQGPQGPAGPAGPVTVNVGTTATGAAGSSASVVNSGTSEHVVLDFTIPRGAQGETGPQGATGATGAQGPQGEKGDKGDTGAQGPAGATGATGATGPQGPKGDTGETGATGATGPQGPQGATGPAGAGVAAGGSTGQVLAKKSAADYDTEWVDGGTGGGASWGAITGTLANQADLQAALDAKGTYSKPASGIPSTDMSSAVQTSLTKADSALQEHQSLAAYRTAAAQDAIHDSTKQDVISDLPTIRSGAALGATALQEHQSLSGYATEAWVGQQGFLTQHQSLSAYRTASEQSVIDGSKQDVSNLVTSVSSASTDAQYPSAKCVYDMCGNIEALLEAML